MMFFGIEENFANQNFMTSTHNVIPSWFFPLFCEAVLPNKNGKNEGIQIFYSANVSLTRARLLKQ